MCEGERREGGGQCSCKNMSQLSMSLGFSNPRLHSRGGGSLGFFVFIPQSNVDMCLFEFPFLCVCVSTSAEYLLLPTAAEDILSLSTAA